ncbi:WD40 repeat-like protein [Auricularia subglabra TFB-10046 SS5]|nr:WD40 repeat-like protein [Auricularia subglabra TFB-10046 SS5]
MPHQPRSQPQKQNTQNRRSSPTAHDTDAQHGPARAFLLDVPPEALTHITAFLEPQALLALGQANRLLYDHVKSDNTWLRAFLVYFVRVGPEVALDSVQHRPALRRLRPTWREEYIARYWLIRRWQRSRAPTVTHAPQWAPIGQMHLMVDGAALLTTSPVHGVVARSHALTGKKLKGFIDSRGTLAPRPTGDHPLPSAVALASDGGTGKIAWGFLGGEVALTRLPNVMTLGAPRNALCLPADAHNGAVTCVEFSQPGGHAIASAAADGTVKLWDTRHMRCLWTYTPATPLAERDACANLSFNICAGAIVVGMQTGQILAWTGFKIDAANGTCSTDNLRLATVSAPPVTSPSEDGPTVPPTRAPAVQVDCTAEGKLRLAVRYDGESVVHRVELDQGDTLTVETTTSLPSSHGRLTTLRSSFASSVKSTSTGGDPSHHFVVSGDKAGWIHVYDWPSLQISKSWSAHNDGAITALELTDCLLATGSAGGSITVWDALTYESLRSFSTPVPRNLADVGTQDVHALILADSHVVACVANRVIAWRVDRRLASDLTGGKRKGKAAAARYISPKWQEQLEMKKDIADSIDAMKFSRPTSSRNTGSAYAGQARAQQRTALGDLGLDEAEALEYVLMLSRDEEEARQRQLVSSSLESTSSLASTSSRFSADSIELAPSDTSDSPPDSAQEQEYGEPGDIFPLTPVPSPPVSPQLSPRSSRRSSHSNASRPRTMPTGSNRKVQVTPPFRPEAVEAGTSPSAFSLDGVPILKPRAANGFEEEFPSISPSSPKRHSPPKATAVRPPTAWSRPAAISAGRRPSQASTPEQKHSIVPQDAAEEEEMLRLALASSMAEQ